MDQQTYSALGFFHATATSGLLLALHSRRAELQYRAWLLTWVDVERGRRLAREAVAAAAVAVAVPATAGAA